MARMKNTKRKQPSEVRYPEATYGIVDTSILPNKMIFNSYEIIQNLLNELIDRIISTSTNNIELSLDSMREENVMMRLTQNNKEYNIDEINLHDSNKENEVNELTQFHEENKDTNQILKIHNILKEAKKTKR